MLFDDRTQNNILIDLKAAVAPDTGTGEGRLIDHSLRGAAAEFERAYIALAMVERNGYAVTADREHLVLRARERGMEPLPATRAVWTAGFNIDVAAGTRFSAGELTYVCTGRTGAGEHVLACEQAGTQGNVRREGLEPVGYVDGFESGGLVELLTLARDEEGTEAFRARYVSSLTEARAYGGNRAQYRGMMHGIDGVGACKIYRVTEEERRIRIYFLDSEYKTPGAALVSAVQETVDPAGKQGEGEGLAAIFHVVDILPCASVAVDVEADITLDTGYTWEELLPAVQERLDAYFLELARGWEDGEYITVRVLNINTAAAGVEGVVDVQDTALNGKRENLLLDPDAVPVRGAVTCRQ